MALVTVLGGSGFLGRHVVRALAKQGLRVRVGVRRPDLAGHLLPAGAVGQIQLMQANLRYPASIADALDGVDAVVNLVGILHERGKQSFDAIHSQGVATLAEEARKAGVPALVHVSAIGADAQSTAKYARTKAAGEAVIREKIPDAVILRPSVLFGPEDDFFNRFAGLARLSPVLPLIGGGETRFQPAYVGDVADAVVKAATGRARAGTVYELGGPEILSFRELMTFILKTIHRNRLLVPVPFALARLKARFLGLLPNPPLTVDQVRLLEYDNIVSDPAIADKRTFEGLAITPQGIDAIAPAYLAMYRRAGQFSNGPTNAAS